MSESETVYNEPEKDAEIMKDAFRFPKVGTIEKLIVQHLLQATFTNETNILIYHTKTAVGIVEQLPEKEKLQELNFERFKIVGTLNNAFSNVTRQTLQDCTVFKLSLGITPSPENYEKYISEWVCNVEFYPKGIRINRAEAYIITHKIRDEWGILSEKKCNYPLYTYTINDERRQPKNATQQQVRNYILEKVPTICPACGKKINSLSFGSIPTSVVNYDAPNWSLFFEQITCLTENGFMQLKKAFEKWAVEQCEHAITYLSNFVSPTTYDEMLKIMSPKIQQNYKKHSSGGD